MFKKRLWLGLTSILAFLLVIMISATAIGFENASFINNAMGLSTSKIVSPGDPDYPGDSDGTEEDTMYFKSAYGELNEANQKKLIEDSWEQNINEMKEGAALLLNKEVGGKPALPLASDASVSLFGHAQVQPFFFCVSAGSRPVAGYNPSLFDAMKDDGFSVNEELQAALDATDTLRGDRGQWTYGSAYGYEDPISVYTDEVRSSWAEDYQDAAIFTIVREAGEHEDVKMYDNLESDGKPGKWIDAYDRYLDREGRVSALAITYREADILDMLKAEKAAGRFKKIIVLLSTLNPMEVHWLDDYDVDACMFVGCYGAQGARGVSSLLSGETNPSGRLVETYAVNSTSAPATINSLENTPKYENFEEIDETIGSNENGQFMTFQAEGIYIGYKYYETRYEDAVLNRGNATSAKGAVSGATSWKYENEVSYPFGYGLSYTTFTQTLNGVTYDASKDVYNVEVTVKNTGDVAGKNVVQVYAQTPYGEYEKTNKVEKSAIQLVGFGKTGMLEPEKTETVTIEVDRYLLASYDYVNAKGYILSEGDYYLAIGDNAHDALNNVIKTKKSDVSGLVNIDGTSATGDTSKVYHFTNGLDTATYKTSSEGVVVTNKFEDCDLNYWIKDSGKYLSRSDWDKTWPVRTTVTATKEMMDVLKGEYYVKPSDSPTLATATADLGKDLGIKFVTMKDVPYDDDVTWNQFLKQMTLDELLTIVDCRDGRPAVEKVALPATKVGDGCDGIAGTFPFAYEDTTGKWGSGKIEAGKMATTRYASKTILTMTYNRDLYKSRGEFMGEDGLWSGCTESWCVGANIKRTPFIGRGAEYMTEDANLAYMAAIPEVVAMEEKGMLAGIKHFTANDQENQRRGVSTFFNEQAFREGALRAFEGAIRVGKCKTLMQAFNRVGMKFASSSSALNIDVCENEWGFVGHKETDAVSNAKNGYLGHYATMLANGTDTFCYNRAGTAKNILLTQLQETDDGHFVTEVLETAKNFFYAMSRSNAINGLSSESIVITILPWWQGLCIAGIVIFGVLTAGCVVMLLISAKKEG